MRTILRTLVFLSLTSALVACSQGYRGTDANTPRAQRTRYPPALEMEPACTYRVLGVVEVLGDGSYGRKPVGALQRQGRSMGAHAVIVMSTPAPVYTTVSTPNDSTSSISTSLVGYRWNGHAIQFSDPTNPNCYSDGRSRLTEM